MKLRKVVSGGQTGADRTGLECARRLGLETGGFAPKGWRTDEGPDPALADFGLVEHHSAAYPPRTEANVRLGDATVWFGWPESPGGQLTRTLCRRYGRPFIPNPEPLAFAQVAESYATINVAGNRRRINPAVVAQVEQAFAGLQS